MFILYIAIPYSGGIRILNADEKTEEIRRQIIIAMLEEFPTLKEKIKDYLKEHDLKRR
jgi:hypothetical protein